MQKRVPGLLLTIFLSLILFAAVAHAESGAVTVKLPAFKVTLNGIAIENKTNQYPLIVYKDITYFPMTYYDSRFLGLESQWKGNKGLAVVKTGANWGYHKYQASTQNKDIYTARVASFPITVNGKKIDNSKEEYPLLLFRNATYFPLTWRFAADEFGWKYAFDPANGLVIHSGSSNPVAGGLTLPITTLKNGAKGAFTMAGDYFYYQGAQGKIYQAPVAEPAGAKQVYQLPLDGYTGDYVLASLRTENGEALLSFHTGGVTMGSDHLVWLKENGASEEIDSGYSALKIYADYTLRVNQGVPPFPNNLQIKKTGETAYQSIGEPNYLYGWVWSADAGASSGKPSKDLYLVGDKIYVLACPDKEEPTAVTGIYSVHIKTNATESVVEEAAAGFTIVGDRIYFTDKNNYLYRIPLAGGAAQGLTEAAVGHYEALRGNVFYTLTDRNHQLFILGKEDPINPGGQVKSLEVQEGFLIAVFAKESESPYKMMILKEDGKVIYKTTENVLLVRIENGKVVFVKDN
ncbi:MAG: DUF5050 domain-containing protein [Clostridia bacterium]|jgi:hypothetical protein|nr:DUF5050 domain-containing protein [Clostridia bacterium]